MGRHLAAARGSGGGQGRFLEVPLNLSGTHASLQQRLGVIESLLNASDIQRQSLGIAALDKVLQTFFQSSQPFEFGARSRNYGYQPQSDAEIVGWYTDALTFIERLALKEGVLTAELRELLANRFRGLWPIAGLVDELEQVMRLFARDEFWCAGWLACRQRLKLDEYRLSQESRARLAALGDQLKPSSLHDEVCAVAKGDMAGQFYLEALNDDGWQHESDRLDQLAHELAAQLLRDEPAFSRTLPSLLQGGGRVLHFGRGFAREVPDRRAMWERMVVEFGGINPKQRSAQLLRGFLVEVWELDQELAKDLLDSAACCPILRDEFTGLQATVTLDESAIERLVRVLDVGLVPVWQFRALAFGLVKARLSGSQIKNLLLRLADKPDGIDVALEILDFHLHSDPFAQRLLDHELIEAGRDLICRITFEKTSESDDYRLARIVEVCCAGVGGENAAAAVATQLKTAVDIGHTYWFSNPDVTQALLKLHPQVVLDELIGGEDPARLAGSLGFDCSASYRGNPIDVVSCAELLVWCEKEPARRWLLAASVITFAHREAEGGPKNWTEQAILLLAKASDPQRVLEIFIRRFSPMTWGGSRAALIEENARLLDSVEPHVPPGLMPFVTAAKTLLAQEVAYERKRETERDRAQDERFE